MEVIHNKIFSIHHTISGALTPQAPSKTFVPLEQAALTDTLSIWGKKTCITPIVSSAIEEKYRIHPEERISLVTNVQPQSLVVSVASIKGNALLLQFPQVKIIKSGMHKARKSTYRAV